MPTDDPGRSEREWNLLGHPCPPWCTGLHVKDPPKEPESWHHQGAEVGDWLEHGVGTDGEALVQLVQYPFAGRLTERAPYAYVFIRADGGQHTPQQLGEFADAVGRYVDQVRALVGQLEQAQREA